MAVQETQLISKMVTDDTEILYLKVRIGGDGGGGGEFRWGEGMQQGWEMLYLNLQLLITAPNVPYPVNTDVLPTPIVSHIID